MGAGELNVDIYYRLTTLDEHKQALYKDIDRRTQELIFQGFAYGGKVFSLSLPAQINISGLAQNKDIMTYPLSWNTINDEDTYSIVDAADAQNFQNTALGTIQVHQQSGDTLKVEARAKTTIDEIKAIVDAR